MKKTELYALPFPQSIGQPWFQEDTRLRRGWERRCQRYGRMAWGYSCGNSSGRVTREALYLNRLGLVVAENHDEMPSKAPVWSPCNEAYWLTEGGTLCCLPTLC